MKPRGLALITLALITLALACKPPPVVDGGSATREPTLVVERPGDAPTCDLLDSKPAEFAIEEHDDWLDLWNDRALASEGDEPPTSSADARERLCALTQELSEGELTCTDAGRQVLTIPIDYSLSMLVVAPGERGLRSIEISRWEQMCRCSCGSWLTLLDREPLSLVVAEYEAMSIDVHFEDGGIVEGCDDDDDECQTACGGEAYGSQRLLVFDGSLGVRDSFVDEAVNVDGEFVVRFAADQGRLTATDECTQVLVE